MDKNRERLDKEFWVAWLALSQTLTALREAIEGRPLKKERAGAGGKKAKPPKGPAVALSTTSQELFVVFQRC